MNIQCVLGVVLLVAEAASVRECVREVDGLQVVLAIPPVSAELGTEQASESASVELGEEVVQILGT